MKKEKKHEERTYTASFGDECDCVDCTTDKPVSTKLPNSGKTDKVDNSVSTDDQLIHGC